MATNIRPLHDRVIVRRIEEGEQVEAVSSSFRIPQRKNPRKARSSQQARANIRTMGPDKRWMLRPATAFCLGSTAAQKSRLTEKSFSSCARMKFWESSSEPAQQVAARRAASSLRTQPLFSLVQAATQYPPIK